MGWPGGWISGFCCIGSCEGTKPKGAISGTPMKTCTISGCNCKCHKDLDRLFEMTGMARVVQENSEYVPTRIVIPKLTIEDRAARFIRRDAVPPTIIESPLPTRVPATIERHYTPKASGRAGRGELELWVKKGCDHWIVEKVEDSCTPAWLSDHIAETQGVKNPSVGAISAVFERWSTLGFALVAKKPTRFIGYTPDGVTYGLEGLKDRARAKAR